MDHLASNCAPEITKDSASEGNFSEDDYLDGRRGARGHHGPSAGHYDPRGIPRSHTERGRPPPLPHERGHMDHHPPPPHDRYEMSKGQYLNISASILVSARCC